MLYPINKNFDSQKRLIRKVNRNGESIEFKTKIEKIFYYTNGKLNKAKVILFSYEYDSETKSVASCHGCSPEFEISTFLYTNKGWIKQNFIENWDGATGSWGEGAEVKLGTLNKKKCLVIYFGFTNQGVTQSITDYYDIETLIKLKSISK